jgi:hypothetical protein
VDSDLADSVRALKAIFEKRFIPANFGKNDDDVVKRLKQRLELTDRYASLLAEADPLDVETVTPPERIRFVPAAELEQEQVGYSKGDGDTPAMSGWRGDWIVIAHSSMLGDPYFLDISKSDAEGDCPVMTAMSGTDHVQPTLGASNLATFLGILAAAMEVAEGFRTDGHNLDDEHIFREALAPKIRLIDPAALRAGHWT